MGAKAPKRLTILSILALIGAASGTYLSQRYYDLRVGAAGHSICAVSAKFNCDAVAMSRYAELVFGIPVSSAVAGWFIGLFILTLVGRNPYWRREFHRISLAAIAFGCAFALYLLYVMVTILYTYCLFCMVIEGVLFASLVILLSLHNQMKGELDRAKLKKLLLTLAGGLVAGVLLLKTLDNLNSVSSTQIQEVADQSLASPVLPIQVGASPVEGDPNAPITITEFSDFQCPHCRHGVGILKALLERYPGKIRIVFKNYPIDSTCNRKMPQPAHPAACEAARIADCANAQGKFMPVYEKLFEEQETLTQPGRLLKLAEEAGADPVKIAACEKSAEAAQHLSADIEEGIRLNVESTPTFFINGHILLGAWPVPVWDRVIERLLNEAH